MGSSQSVFASLNSGKQKFILPIPRHIFNPIHTRKRKRVSKYVQSFNLFVNSPFRIKSIITVGMQNFQTFSGYVTRFMYSSDAFHEFWQKPGHEAELLDLEIRGTTLHAGEDLEALKTDLKRALKHNTDYFRAATLMVHGGVEDEGVAHANICVFKYTQKTRRLSCHLFEPHAQATQMIDDRLGALKALLNGVSSSMYRERGLFEWGKWLVGFADVTVQASFPSSDAGLQTNSPICVQWSLIMYLMYMLNCEVYGGGECGESGFNFALGILWDLRKQFIPTWLFFMELMYHETLVIKSQSREKMREALTNTPVPYYLLCKFGDQRFLDNTDDDSVDSALDYSDCTGRSSGDCTSPCEWDNGRCFNATLFQKRKKQK